MKKNYPFSNKALKALLVASIAFSPVVTTGIVDNPSANAETQTQYSSVDQLVDRFKEIYDTLGDTDKKILLDARVALDGMTEAEWKAILEKVTVNNAEVTLADKVAVSKAVAKVIYSANADELAANVADFQNEYTNEVVQTVFGETVTSESLLNYIAEIELELFELLKDKDLENLSTLQFYAIAVLALENAKTGYTAEYEALTTTVDVPSIFIIKDELQLKVDPDRKVKGVLFRAFQKLQEDGDGGDTGGYYPAPAPAPAPAPEITIPVGGSEVVEDGNEVITKIKSTSVDAIVNQITSEKSVIKIELQEVADGKVAKATVPANLFTEAAKKNAKVVVEVATKDGSYKLPVNQINLKNLDKELGNDVEISISVNVVDAPADSKLKLASNVLEFKVTASSVDGKTTKEIIRFTQYVEREIVSDKNFKSNTSVAVRLNDNGTFTAVPTVFDGNNATIKSLTNSKYVIVENTKTFVDVDGGKNWAEAHIEKLASKYIINGKTETSYAPGADITRGEFAALISRSLGLVATDATAVNFEDVSSKQAINKNGEIAAVVEAGIIKGKTDGKFYPGEKITRADAAIMISRAMDYVNADLSGLNTSKDLTDLTDYQKVGSASKDAVVKVMQADIMNGFGDGSFGPEATTKRDQMAKILDKFLQFVKFVN